MWGRWRPSACARRAGPAGVLLDQLLTRDAVSLDEALARVRERYDVSELELRSLVVKIPVRTRADSSDKRVSTGSLRT